MAAVQLSPEKSALKKTTYAASIIGQLEAATTVNEVGASFSDTPPGLQAANINLPKRQYIGDKEVERKWIRANMTMKICKSFQQDPKNKEACACGRKKNKEHMPSALLNHCVSKWNALSEDCVAGLPTTAYGEIEFPNANIAKYVRVSDDTDMEDMMYLLTDIWGLQRPNLLISVTGGAKNICMSKKLKDAFKTGLLKTAQTTGAWILSGGNNDGVMKYLGEAVNMLQSSSKVVAFGIAPWGCVTNKRELSSAEGMWPAYYQLREDIPRGSANLDPNHTHFILVDNGTFRKFGTEIDFRGLFEKHISQMMTDADEASATNVPVVSIVVEGGPGTLTTVRAAIDNATPVVVLEGSGRAADILAYAYNHTVEEEVTTFDENGKTVLEKIPRLPDDIQKKLRAKVELEWPTKNTDELVQIIIHCVMRRHLMVIFSLDDKNTMKDIDIAILHAIMKANKNDAMNQLKLALAWNRIDVVRDEIFTEDKAWDSKELEDILLTALIQNKADFVDLLMDHIHLGNFVTKKRLLELYNAIPSNHLLYRLLMAEKDKEKATVSLCNVGDAIQSLVGDFYNPLYLRDTRYNSLDSDEILGRIQRRPKTTVGRRRWLHRRGTFLTAGDSSESEEELPRDTATTSHGFGAAIGAKPLDIAKHKAQVVPTEMARTGKKRKYDFDWPARELLIWSILMRRKDLAMLFLREEKYAIAPALIASIMLRHMMHQTYTVDAEVIEEIEALAKEFENIAIGVLGECFTANEFKSKTLLIRLIPSYGETTLLQLAVEANNKEFVSHQACQNLLNNIWWGKMDELQGEWRPILSLLCPPLLFCLIHFRNEDELKERRVKMAKKRTKKKGKEDRFARTEGIEKTLDERALNQRPSRDIDTEAADDDDDNEFEMLSWPEKIVAFFNAPKVTFMANTIFYLAFLVLFTYMMLCDFHPERTTQYTTVEVIVAFWVITLFIEELRQFWVAETNSFKMKILNYFSDVWNLVDIITVTLFIVGYILRIIDHEAIIVQDTLKQSAKLFENGRDELDGWLYSRKGNDTLVADRHGYARIILCFALMTFWFRILHIFSVIRQLGPKLVMIGRMIKDLLFFGVVLMVFITSFGIAQHAILYPNQEPSAVLAYDIVRMPYWQMYGELFLEDLEGENEEMCGVPQCTKDPHCFSMQEFLTDHAINRTCKDGSDPTDIFGTCADGTDIDCYTGSNVPKDMPLSAFPGEKVVFCYSNSTNVTIPECLSDLDPCPEVNRMVPVLLGVYILFTQILMFNLLIAMFSYTFTLVQENTDMHWKFQQYAMIKEYYTRPPIPPPFIILNHIALLIRHIYRSCRVNDTIIGDDFKMIMEEQYEKQLAVWERINYEDFSRKQQIIEEASVDFKVAKSTNDLDLLVASAEGMANLPRLYDRIDCMEARLNDTSEALNWIMDALASSKMGKGKPPMMKIEDDEVTRQEVLDAEEKLFLEWKAKKNNFVHVKCRASPYLKATRIRRFPVPNTKVYWEINWSGYQPVRYTADDILSGNADYADPDIFKMKKSEAEFRFKFNQQDGDICRVSFHGTYALDTNMLPLNPFGRTGLTGRGGLGRWGPNHALDAIVSRWKRFGNGDIELRKEKKVLEFLGVKRSDVDEWSLPGILYESSQIWRELMADQSPDAREEVALAAIKEKAFGDCMTEDCKAALGAISNPKIIYEGYCDDPRNTDNAWVETLAYNFHDDTSETTKDLNLKPGSRVTKVAWIEASADLILFAGHGMIVKKLIETHNAAY